MAGYILWGLLAFLGLALCLILFVPVRVFFRFHDGDITAWAKILWVFRFSLYPTPERKPKKEKKKKTGEAPPPEEPPKKEKGPVHSLMDLLGTIGDLLPHLGRSAGYILRRLTLRRCRITMVAGKEDAAKTAIYVGQLYAAGYNVYALLCSFIRVKEFKFHVTPDYTGPSQKAAADVMASIRLSTLLAGGILFLFHWLALQLKTQKQANRRKRRRRKRTGRTQPATT